MKNMNLKLKGIFCLGVVLLWSVTAAAAPPKKQKKVQSEDEAKQLSGMSIVGNDEAPKSLYIVPWKSSEIGVETGLDMMLDKDAVPVDREVFKRQIDFYEVSTTNRTRRIR